MQHKPTKEQERIFNCVQNRPENILIEAFAGAGKCLGINTPVLMYDGTIKPVQEIKIGEFIMGDDSTPRRVLNTNTGEGELCKIIPTKGESWICNDIHMMSLHHELKKTIVDIPLNEINVPKYSNGNFRYLRLQRSGVDFPDSKLNIDPYLMGLWLGDGKKEDGSPTIFVHISETPILDYLRNIKYKDIVPKFNEYQENLLNVDLTTPNFNGRKVKNLIRNEFRKCLNLDGSFSIPQNYLINSRENRLKLLAGIIDTDGHLSKKYYEIISKYKSFANDLLFLCRSLGFAAYISKKIGTIKSIGFSGEYWRITISGSFEDVPCLLSRKISKPRLQIKSVLRTGFRSVNIGNGKYFGFTLDGNGRFLLGDFTITHNTSTIVEAVHLLPIDKSITFLAFNKHIQEELKTKLPEYVRCYTTYGLGMGAIKRKYGDKIKFDEFKADKWILKKSKSWNLDDEFDSDVEKGAYFNQIKKLVNLCRLTITTKEDYIEYLAERHDITARKPKDVKRVMKVLDGMTNDRTIFDYTDMIYLPAIDNSIWMFPQDYVLVDEVQDFNRCQIKIIEKILKKDKVSGKIVGRLIGVGDANQCQPKGTKILMFDGLEKNIEDIVIGDKVVTYDRHDKGYFVGFYKNHRWGAESMKSHGYNINNISKRMFSGNLIVVKSNNKTSKYTPNHKCMVRIIKGSNHKYMLYLMERNGLFRIGIVSVWGKDGINFAANRTKQEDAHKMWVLKTYENRLDAYSDEQYYSTMFSIPQLIFYYREQKGNINQEYINSFYDRFNKRDLRANAILLMEQFNRNIDYPFWEKGTGCYFSKEHMFELNACNIIPDIMQVILFDENNVIKKQSKGYEKKILTPIYSNIDELSYEKIDEYVYSLEVDKHELYIADGILTHNCIYGFNAADEKSFNWFKEFPNTKALPLSYSFRCAKNIIKEANTLVPDIKALENAPDGIVRSGSAIDEAESGDFILCRTTMPLVKLFFEFLIQHKKAIVKGSDIGIHLGELIGSITTISKLSDYWQGEVNRFKRELISKGILNPYEHSGYVALEDKVSTLLFIAKMSNDIIDLKNKIKAIFTDEIQGIVLSTVHKAKGLEANRVFIIRPDLMPLPNSRGWQAAQEKNLHYVAVTRAKYELVYDNEWTDETD